MNTSFRITGQCWRKMEECIPIPHLQFISTKLMCQWHTPPDYFLPQSISVPPYLLNGFWRVYPNFIFFDDRLKTLYRGDLLEDLRGDALLSALWRHIHASQGHWKTDDSRVGSREHHWRQQLPTSICTAQYFTHRLDKLTSSSSSSYRPFIVRLLQDVHKCITLSQHYIKTV